MTRQLDSGALTELARILQLGRGGEQTTSLDDGNVSQVLDINQIIRRSLTFANTSGLFFFTFENVHPGADIQATNVNPYAVTAGVNGFPTIVPPGFDVWLLYCSARRTAGAGGPSSGIPELSQQSTFRGKGPQLGTSLMALGRWNAVEGTSGQSYFVTPQNDTLIRPMLRMRRGATLTFRTTSTAAATFEMFAAVVALPAGLGQDGAA